MNTTTTWTHDLITEIQKATNCIVIADSASTKKLQLTIPADKLQESKPGAETKIGEVSIKTEKCNHSAQAPVTYIITSEDDVKVYHTADSLPFPELAVMGQKEKFDVVFCTVGIAPGSTPQTGFEIARLTKPQACSPLSYCYSLKSNRVCPTAKEGASPNWMLDS